jgi:hypothetical protein
MTLTFSFQEFVLNANPFLYTYEQENKVNLIKVKVNFLNNVIYNYTPL